MTIYNMKNMSSESAHLTKNLLTIFHIAKLLSKPVIIVPLAVFLSVMIYLVIRYTFGMPIQTSGLVLSTTIPLLVATPFTYLTHWFVAYIEKQNIEIEAQKKVLENLV